MSKITDLISKLSAASEEEQTQAILAIIKKHEAALIDLNIAQLNAGKNARGEQLGIYRNRNYAIFKNRLNPLPGLGIWDLKLTGSLQAGMYANTTSFPINIDSTDSKADKFRDASPFNLDENSLAEYREEVKPDIQEYYRSIF